MYPKHRLLDCPVETKARNYAPNPSASGSSGEALDTEATASAVQLKRVSIVIPAFNAERTLRGTIASVFEQTYPVIELIVINDGSLDGTAAILAQYRETGAPVQITHTVNQGASAARNLGISQSSGDYLIFLDADDILEPDAVTQLVSYLEQTDADLATAGHKQVRDERQVFLKSGEVSCDTVFDRNELYAYLNSYLQEPYTYTMLVHCWNKLYKTRILKNGIYFNESLSQFEDVDFNARYLMQCRRVCYKANYLYHHTISSRHISMSNLTGRESDALIKFKQAYASLEVLLQALAKDQNDHVIARKVGHLYVTTVIIALMRICREIRISALPNIWRLVRQMIGNDMLRSVLDCYTPGRHDSRCIYWALKWNSPVLAMFFAFWRTYQRRFHWRVVNKY